jgi:class 3 adenylate cyclase
MGLDEVGTARTLREHREVTDALVAKHDDRLVKTTGDGALFEFPLVVNAVECSVAVQAVMVQRNEGVPVDRQMLFRIAINLGDILIEGDADATGLRDTFEPSRDIDAITLIIEVAAYG